MFRWRLGLQWLGATAYSTYTYKWGITWGYNPLILTFDPNFQRDILESSSSFGFVPFVFWRVKGESFTQKTQSQGEQILYQLIWTTFSTTITW